MDVERILFGPHAFICVACFGKGQWAIVLPFGRMFDTLDSDKATGQCFACGEVGRNRVFPTAARFEPGLIFVLFFLAYGMSWVIRLFLFPDVAFWLTFVVPACACVCGVGMEFRDRIRWRQYAARCKLGWHPVELLRDAARRV